MIYIYDILLNFNTSLIEFFEWEENDLIKYVKKLPIYKVSDDFLYNLVNNEIKVSDDFLNEIKDKTLFEEKSEEFKYCSLLTNNKIVLGVLFNEFGNVLYLSRLLIEEEKEILTIANRLSLYHINYEICNFNNEISDNLTRKERNIKNNLLNKINDLYKNNDYEKLSYLYYEYFNKIGNSKEEIYNNLIKSINNFNPKHNILYNILKLSEQK